MKLGWRGTLGILLSAIFLWLALRNVDLARVWTVLTHSNLALWAASMVAATAIFPLRARRWAALLEPVAGRLPFRSLWQATAIGMMVNNVAPARAGEFARPFVLSRSEPQVRFAAAFASLAVDRLFDGTVVLMLMLGATLDPAFPALSGALAVSMKGAAVFLLLVLVVLAGIVFAPGRVFALYDGLAGRVAPRLAAKGRALLEHFATGLQVLRSPRLVAEVFVWTVLHWVCNGLAFWLGFRALGLAVPISGALLVQGIVAIGVAAPSAPGFIGVFELASTIGLGLYGVAESDAVSWALGFHLLSYIPITVMGSWYLTRLKLHLRDFGAAPQPTA